MASNRDLQKAKNAKNDEFYTPYDVVVEELSHYSQHFKGKTVLCNCDNPFTSNFCKYFLRNFNVLGLKRLICTSLCMADDKDTAGYVLNVGMFCKGCQCVISESTVNEYLAQSGAVKRLRGNGDFRSEECVSYLRKSDIVVTNPPFSLFKELMSLISRHRKKFLLIGNQNALTYKEVFPLIQRNEAWVGYRFGDMKLMRTGSQKLYNHQASRHATVAIKKLMMIPPERGKECLPKDMIGRQVFSGTWGRLRWDAPSPTIDTRFDAASNGTNNHPYLHRAITPREAARIQSFDDNFVFIGGRVQVRQQIGNAVPPLLAKAIADQIDIAMQKKE